MRTGPAERSMGTVGILPHLILEGSKGGWGRLRPTHTCPLKFENVPSGPDIYRSDRNRLRISHKPQLLKRLIYKLE